MRSTDETYDSQQKNQIDIDNRMLSELIQQGGCVFLMSKPYKDGNFNISDGRHFYLYINNGIISYYLQGKQKHDLNLKQFPWLNESLFTSPEINPIIFIRKRVTKVVLVIASRRGHTQSGPVGAAIDLYKKIKKEGRATSYTYNIMLNMWAQLGNVEKSEKFLNKVLNTETRIEYLRNALCMLLNAYANTKELTPEIIKKAEDLYKKIDGEGRNKYGALASTKDYKDGIMLKLHARLGDVKNAKIYFDNMGDYVNNPCNHAKSMLLTAYANAKVITVEDIKEVKSLIFDFENASNADYKTMLTIYAKANVIPAQELEEAILFLHFANPSDADYKNMLTIYTKANTVTAEDLKAAKSLFLRFANPSDADHKNMLTIYSKANAITVKELEEVKSLFLRFTNASDADYKIMLTIYAKANVITSAELKEAKSLYNCIRMTGASDADKESMRKIYETNTKIEVDDVIYGHVNKPVKNYIISEKKPLFFNHDRINSHDRVNSIDKNINLDDEQNKLLFSQ